jgi:hypothetical protein
VKINKGETIVELLPGQFIFGRFKAEEELNIDGSTIYKWIQKFSSAEFNLIKIKSNNQYSIITLCKWEEYQNNKNTDITTKEQPHNNHVKTIEQPCNTNKNVKNVKKVKNDKKEEENSTQLFKDSIFTFKNQYSEIMLDEFFNYWSEFNKSKTKMRWELEKVFEISKRLTTWQRNCLKFEKNRSSQKAQSPETRNVKRVNDLWKDEERKLTTSNQDGKK